VRTRLWMARLRGLLVPKWCFLRVVVLASDGRVTLLDRIMRIYGPFYLLIRWLIFIHSICNLDRHFIVVTRTGSYIQRWAAMLRLPVQDDWQGLQNEVAATLHTKQLSIVLGAHQLGLPALLNKIGLVSFPAVT
jgi:hypothetical protein